MFSTLGLFHKLPCPDKPRCQRTNCLYSHASDIVQVPTVPIPVDAPKQPTPSSSKTPLKEHVTPAKRSIGLVERPRISNSNPSKHIEPPRKLQRIGTPQRPAAAPTSLAFGNDGVPLLKVNAAQSQVAVPVRQAMVKSLFVHFKVLYEAILDRNPTLAAEHALRQEEEVYKSAHKLTYRNAVISCVAKIKQRPRPDSVGHPSVGTEEDLAKRAEEQQKLAALRLTAEQLESYVLSLDEMRKWDYVVDIPVGPGGQRPSEEGAVMKCDRCGQPFQVKRQEEADETTDEDPCTHGPHVFYESDPEKLHMRHAFSFSRSETCDDKALDVVALDCEMIYTTGGMRVARVSVVDAAGKTIFDELVQMDDGVEVIDFNTRFSGVTPDDYAHAVLDLASVRLALDAYINARTIVIGHALENDLKTLRMVHHRCVDTATMPAFRHKLGAPYRPALRVLAKAHLGKTIQEGGGSVGHSSVEDSVATLDLVRWHLLHHPTPPPKPKPPIPSDGSTSASATPT
ncbi:hypothetical protein EIP86_004762 [Pleurotus ostreatoroseus]|nr:hypothetical protein EIP86_004762 [Pleurotus ostreatoroseus]